MFLSEKQEENLKQVLDEKELIYYGNLLKEIDYAQEQRDKSHSEFDDLTYFQDYIKNKRAANTYLQATKNKSEVKINTPTTEKKIESVHNELLQLNLQPTVYAYDDNDTELEELGQDFTDIVKRTNEIETDEDMWIFVIQELITQRAVFLEEYFDKKICKKRLISGLQVYLGDITIPYYLFNSQPFIVHYKRLDYQTAEKFYGKNKNWQYVKKGVVDSGMYDYRMYKTLPSNEVEIITYNNLNKKHQQILINGVMMNEIDAPLPWKHEGYNITMTAIKGISNDFAYGRPSVAGARVLQALDNETIRLMIRKFRQAIEPPIGVKSGKILSKNIWNPSAQTQGLKERDIFKLIDHQGVTSSEFQMLNLIESKIEEFLSSGNLQQGLPDNRGKRTATETITLQRQALKMIGLAVFALIRLKREITYLRIFNILDKYSSPIKKKVNYLDKIENIYKKFTIKDGNIENNQRGKKIVQFLDRDLTEKEEEGIYEEEQKQEKVGRKIRYKTLNIKKVKQIRLNWYVLVESTEREGSFLKKAMFESQLNQAAGIMKLTGKRLNADKIIDEFERVWRVKNIFSEEEPQQEMEGGEEVDKMISELDSMSGAGNNIKKAGMQSEGAPLKPSLNTMAQA